MIQTTPFTTGALGVGLVFLIFAFLGYWYIGTEKQKLSYNFRRALTLYNMFLACFHFVVVVMASEVVGTNGSVAGFGSTITSRGGLAQTKFMCCIHIYIYIHCVHIYMYTVYIYIYVYVYVHIMYTYVYIYTYIYIYIHSCYGGFQDPP